jgi:hypothetical protein
MMAVRRSGMFAYHRCQLEAVRSGMTTSISTTATHVATGPQRLLAEFA